MNFLNKLFGKETNNLSPIEAFWTWFCKHERNFHAIVNSGKAIDGRFFDRLRPELDKISEGIYFLSGMYDKNVAELILSAEGYAKYFFKVEDIIEQAPDLPRWKFTAHKEEHPIENANINMQGVEFSQKTLSFYANENSDFPDEIDLTIVHSNYEKEDKDFFVNGTYIFLDIFLGELKCSTIIDNLSVQGPAKLAPELIPIEKLKSYLNWREKEFIEKYSGVRHDTDLDEFKSLEATYQGGNQVIAIVNSTLLNWDAKASHPWILEIQLDYKSSNNGMPGQQTLASMNEFENQLMTQLVDSDGYLNVGRTTGRNKRNIFFACKDFRKASKYTLQLIKEQSDKTPPFEMGYEVFKDKYWRCLSHLGD